MHKFVENIKSSYGQASTALGSETSDKIAVTAFLDMSKYDLYTAVAHVVNSATSVVTTLTIYEATAAAGTGSQSLAITDTFTAVATSDTDVLVAQVRAEQLSAGYQYAGAVLSSSSSSGAEICGIIQFQSRARYAQATLP